MNKTDLVTMVAEQTDLPRVKTAELVDAVLAAIEHGLRASKDVRLVGFGTFTLSRRAASRGRNPRTGAEILIPASTAVKFKPGKSLKNALN